MKNMTMLVWFTQLGLSVVVPLAGFTWLGVWLRQQLGWGIWAVIVGAVLGLVCAVDGLRTSLKAMDRMAKEDKEEKPPVSFNDHD